MWDTHQLVLVVSSTTGDGVPPTESKEFFDAMMTAKPNSDQWDLSSLHFSVLSLGDSNYVHFCRTGKAFDNKFQGMYIYIYMQICERE